MASGIRAKAAIWSAMLPGMVHKPRIVIIGAGNLGSALALSLHGAGFVIHAVVGHSASSRARTSAKRVAAEFSDRLPSDADLVWFCVPDSEIEHVAQECAGAADWKGRVALHSSGVLTSAALRPLQKRGASAASVHPLMTFVRNSQVSFQGVAFAIEGDRAATRAARQIVSRLGGTAYSIRKNEKAAYHAWGTFASPLLTSLLAATEQVARLAGVHKKQAVRRMMPILRQTLSNYESFGGAEGFSGPIIRGDVETVRRHLRVLLREPAAREVYVALAQAALEYLPGKNKTEIGRVLTHTSRSRKS